MNRLRILRKENKDTQEDLANYLGVKGSSISHWETGKHRPSEEILMKIADRYGVSTDYLLEYSEMREFPVENHIRFLAEYLSTKTGEVYPIKYIEQFDRLIGEVIALHYILDK